MKSLSFACPKCKNRFTFKVDYIPEGLSIIQTCPFCYEEIEFKPDDVIDEPGCKIINLSERRRENNKK